MTSIVLMMKTKLGRYCSDKVLHYVQYNYGKSKMDIVPIKLVHAEHILHANREWYGILLSSSFVEFS